MAVLSRVKALPQWYKDYYTKIDADPGLLEYDESVKEAAGVPHDTVSKEGRSKPYSDHIYHIILTSTQVGKDPNQCIEKLRIIGAYDDLRLAKAAAHRALFDAGYEAEFFKQYGITPWAFEKQHVAQKVRQGLMIDAIAQDDTRFQVRLATTPNESHWISDLDDGRIFLELYYVVQTTMEYRDGLEGEGARNHIIEGCFEKYDAARSLAMSVLINKDDGLSRSSFAQYDEAGPNDVDCGFGMNVLVHAVGEDGENIMISVVKGHVLESVRLMEATMRMR